MKIRLLSILRQPLWLMRSLCLVFSEDRWRAYSVSPKHKLSSIQTLDERVLLNATPASLLGGQSQATELVIVDGGIKDSELILDDLRRQQAQGRAIEILQIAPDQDGIDLISERLAHENDLKAIHVISHGADGLIRLGNTNLDLGTLQGNRGREIENWSSALAPDGDLLLYGCSVADTMAGKQFVNALSQRTGADVAASTNLTGAAVLGGDWSLEYHSGQIDIESLYTQKELGLSGVLTLTASGGETRANTTTTNIQQTTILSGNQVASDASGKYVVVWEDTVTDYVYARQYNADGTPATGEFQVNTDITAARNKDQPTVAMDSSGNFVIAWRSELQDGSLFGIYAQRYNSSAVPQGSEFRVNTTTANTQERPAIAMNSNGFVITWTSAVQDGSNDGVYAQRYNASGVAQGSEFRVNTTTTRNQNGSDIGMDSSGNFVIAWTSDNAGTEMLEVYAQRYNASGVAQGGETRINTTTTKDQILSSVSMNASGNYVIAWTSEDQDGNFDGAYARLYNSSGTAISAEIQLNSTTTNEQRYPSVSMDSSGQFLATWTSKTQDGSLEGVYVRQFSATGTALTSETLVNTTTTSDQEFSSVTWNGNQAVVIWSGNGTGDNAGVFFQRYTAGVAPIITSNGGGATASVSVAENTTAVTTVTATDADGGTLTYSISGGSDSAKFTINSSTGVLTFISAPDFETPTDSNGDNIYNVTVQVSDGSLTDTQAIAVTVTDVSNQLVITTTADNNDSGITTGDIEWLNANKGVDGAVSLREALIAANNSTGTASITFNLTTSDPNYNATTQKWTFALTSALPTISKPVTIDGTTQSGWTAGNPVIVLNGTSAGAGANGIDLATGSAGSTVKGLVINGFNGAGINISSASNMIQGNWIGLNATGTAKLANGGGVRITNAANNTIGGSTSLQRNVISGNTGDGIDLLGASSGTIIQGNYIGTNALGNSILGNGGNGVCVNDNSTGTIVGGSGNGEGNVISGNAGYGVYLSTANNTVQGNTIGLNVLGNAPLANNFGVYIENASSNIVGGTDVGTRNVISGNTNDGVYITGSSATGNVIRGNYIGLGSDGSTVLGNSGSGVNILSSASGNTIGGSVSGAGNVISGNSSYGVYLQAGSNTVSGNIIGLNAAGMAKKANSVGVRIDNATNNTIGGTTSLQRNVISGNTGDGVSINGGSATGNVISGNYIGTDVNGSTSLGNSSAGVSITNAAGNGVGGAAVVGNVISGNGAAGIYTLHSGNHTIQGNIIGLNATGTAKLANSRGIEFTSSTNNTLGGTTPETRNVISGNTNEGIIADGFANATIQGNYIGLGSDGSTVLGNGGHGINLQTFSGGNLVGGSVSGAGNVISGNTGSGVYLDSSSNTVAGNIIGLNATGTATRANSYGVFIANKANNAIGGTTALARNVISGNTNDGVYLTGSSATGNLVKGNYIGLGLDGSTVLGNSGVGVNILSSASGNTIGGSVSGAGNVISGNSSYGVYLQAGSNTVSGNIIGLNAAGTAKKANGEGVRITNATNNTIGGTTSLQRNVISGNTGDGVSINGSAATGNVISGNYIGTDVNGSANLGNGSRGVSINDGSGNTVGGTASGAGNVISGNSGQGIYAFESGSHVIQGNIIGLNAAGTAKIANSRGIEFASSSNNTVGGTTTSARNIVSGNTNEGIVADGFANNITIQGNYIGLGSDGATALGNGSHGVVLQSSGEIVGGSVSGAGNVISGNTGAGIHVQSGGAVISGNTIGLNALGTAALPNSYGVFINNVGNVTIGGTTANSANIISGNTNDGVYVTGASANGNAILQNRIYGNTKLGINLNFSGDPGSGITANDGLTTNNQPNLLIDFPVITLANVVGNTLTLTGYVGSAANQSTFANVRVEFFISDQSSTNGSGKTYLGFLTTNANGNFSGSLDVTGLGLVFTDKLTATATDSSNNTSEFGVNFDVNTTPTDITSGALTVPENSANGTSVVTVAGVDPDSGDTLTYSLTDSAGGRFAIDSSTGAITVANGTLLDFETATSHNITVRVTDGGGLTYDESFTVAVTNVNEAPTITSNGAGTTAAVSVAENSSAVTTVTATDPDAATTLTYSISGGSDAAKFAINSSTGALTFASAPNFESPTDSNADNVYQVIVQASDPNGGSDTQTISVSVTDEDEIPTITSNGAGATAAISISETSTAVTTVTATDPNVNSTLTYSITGGSDSAKFTIDSSTGVLTFLTPPNFESPTDSNGDNIYNVTVQVSNGSLNDSQTIAVTVTNVNESPTAVADIANAVEAGGVGNGTAGTNPSGNVLTNDSDPDTGDTPTVWGVAAGTTLPSSNNAGSNVSGSYGTIAIASDGSYTYTLDNSNAAVQALRTNADTLTETFTYEMRDAGGLSSTAQLTITIRGVNDAPAIASNGGGATASISLAENIAAVTTVTALDPDLSTNLIYSLVGGADVGKFTINPITGVVTFLSAPNFEAPTDANRDNIYLVTVRVSDGSLFSTQAISVMVMNVSEAPNATNFSNNRILENSPRGTIVATAISTNDDRTDTSTYSLVDDSDGRFAINPTTGLITVAKSGMLNFEATPTLTIVVRSTSTAGLTLDKAFTITLLNVNESPTDLMLNTNSLIENAPNAQLVGTFTRTDPDAFDPGRFTLVNNAGGRYTIDRTTGELRLANRQLIDFEGIRSHQIVVRVTDNGGLTYDETFTIELTDANDAPTNLFLNGTTVLENAPIGTSVGLVTRTDPDLGDTALYTLTNDAGGRFAIDSNTGRLTVANGSLLNFEAVKAYPVSIRVTDSGGLSFEKNFTINVANVNEAPSSISLNPTRIAENSVNGTVIGTAVALDPDVGDRATYSLVDSAGGRFAINARTGVVTVANSSLVNFEAAISHSITVRATDMGGLSLDQAYTIQVTNLNEAPSDLLLSGTSIAENSPTGTVVGTATRIDQDNGDSANYSLTNDAAGRFKINSTTGVISIANGSLLDYETNTSHSITVRVVDAGGLAFSKNFTITVLEVNEAPRALTLSPSTIAENAANGTSVGTVTATDPDRNETPTFTLLDNAGGRFAINATTGQVTVANGSLLNFEADRSHTIAVQVTDRGGLTFSNFFTIAVVDVNEAPTDLNLSRNRVARNSSTGSTIGTVTRIDADFGDTATYSLTSNAGGRFAINATTGAITVANASLLVNDANSTQSIAVQVTDRRGLSYTENFTIELVDQMASGLQPILWVPSTGVLTITGMSSNRVTVQQRDGNSGIVDVLDDTGVQSFSANAGQVKKIVYLGSSGVDSLQVNLIVGATFAIELSNVEQFGISSTSALQNVSVTDTDVTSDLTLLNLYLPNAGISITSNNNITQLASTSATVGGQASFSTTNGVIRLDRDNYFQSSVSLVNARGYDVTLNNKQATTLGNVSVPLGGNFAVTSSGGISQASRSNLTVDGRSSFQTTNGRITLDQANSLNGAVTLGNTGANEITLNSTRALTLGSVTTPLGGFNVTSAGPISQVANTILTIGQASTFNSGNNSIILDQANQFGSSVSIRNTGANSIRLNNARDLELGNATLAAGSLNVTSTGNITQRTDSVLSVGGTSSFTATNGSITLTRGNLFNGVVSLISGGTGNVSLNNNRAVQLGTVNVSAGSLSVTSTGNITQTPGTNLSVGGNAGFSTTGGSIVLDQVANRLNGTLDLAALGTGNVTVRDDANLILGNTLVSRGNFDVSTTGNISQSIDTSLSVGGTSSFNATNGSISLARNNTFNGAVSLANTGGQNISLNSGRPLTLGNTTVAGNGNLLITANGTIGQTSTSILNVSGASSFTATGGCITLNRPNLLTGAVSLINDGVNNVSLQNNRSIVLGDTSLTTGNLLLNANGCVTQLVDSILRVGGTTTVNTTGGGIQLDQSNRLSGAVSVTTNGTNSVFLKNDRDLILGNFTLPSGNLVVQANGSIRENATSVLNVGGTSSFNASNGSIDLLGRNQLAGEITLLNAGSGDVNLNNHRATLLGNVTATTGNLSVSALGNLTQNANRSIATFGAANFTATSGSITLNQANQFQGPLGLNVIGAGNATVNYNGSLVLGSTNVSTGNLTVSTTGAISQATNTVAAVGGTSTFNATSGSIILNQANRFNGTVSLRTGTGFDATLNNARAIQLGSIETGGNLAVNATGTITQSTTTSVKSGGTASFNATGGGITLTSANNFAGAISLATTGSFGVSLRNNAAVTLGSVTLGTGSLSVLSAGNITQLANTSVQVGGTSTFNATNGSINLTQSNALAGSVSLTNSGLGNNVALTNNRATTLGSIRSLGNLSVTALQGNITRSSILSILVAGTTSLVATSGTVR